jgi:pimeloyl-ACP methyl ester carboxylesterase
VDIRTGTALRRNAADNAAGPGDIELYYEDMGDPNHPAVLLIMGLGAQLLLWRKGFCEKLVNQGLRVIRYDNRDVGLSTKMTGRRVDSAMVAGLARSFVGKPSPAVYKLEDMADDAAALLDHLGIQQAHVVGGSMGGMIAQIFAAKFPERTKTLGILFSSNNQAFLPPPGYPQLRALLQRPADTTREAIVANAVRVAKIIGSPGYPRPDDQLEADAVEGYERAYYPAGIARHFAAVLGSGSLRRYDEQITAPTLVIHGKADRLMRPSGGRAIARAIKGARVVMIDGMAHDLPEELWDQLVGELKTNFAEAP